MFVATAAKIHSARCGGFATAPIDDLIFAASHDGWCPSFIHWLRENRYLRWPNTPDVLRYYGWVANEDLTMARFDTVPGWKFAAALDEMEPRSNC